MRDPGRERRAEQRARELLRSCVNDEEWAMYRDLGFIRVAGKLFRKSHRAAPREDGSGEPAYAYLVYPHKPIVAYVPKTGRLLSEYCVEFPDLSGAISQTRLPDSDDVLAKWMALTGDEERLIRNANMHLPGRQVDPKRVRRHPCQPVEWARPPRTACGATCGGCRGGSGSAGARARSKRDRERREAAAQPGDPRGPGPGGSARLSQGDRIRRRVARAPDRRHRQHLDRDDAVQL